MTKREIEAELRGIYREMGSWPNINAELEYRIPTDEVQRRELLLIGREELYKLEDARKCKDRLAAGMHEATYNLIRDTLKLSRGRALT